MNPPKIQVYCTVREDELTPSPNGFVCTRCNRTLVDLNDPAAVAAAGSNGPTCGFLRRLAIPALASSLVLSACDSSSAENRPLTGKIAVKTSERPMLAGSPLPPAEVELPPKPPVHPIVIPAVKDFLTGDLTPQGVIEEGKRIKADNLERAAWPLAKAVSGKPGFVTSPYTRKPVDIASIPAGSVVCDPDYPMQAKKYFRIP
jgi:hypothetical protein